MSYSWNINWKSIFNDTKAQYCKVRFRLISTSTNTLSKKFGSIRASLQSNTSNNTNGFNLGEIVVKNEIFNKNNYYLEGNTLTMEGATMIIPTTDTSILTLSIYDINENLLTILPNYNIWLYFDTDI
jgi:hypothetical protein